MNNLIQDGYFQNYCEVMIAKMFPKSKLEVRIVDSSKVVSSVYLVGSLNLEDVLELQKEKFDEDEYATLSSTLRCYDKCVELSPLNVSNPDWRNMYVKGYTADIVKWLESDAGMPIPYSLFLSFNLVVICTLMEICKKFEEELRVYECSDECEAPVII